MKLIQLLTCSPGLCDCVLKCGDSDGAICHCSPNRIVTLVPANLNLNTRDGKLVFDKANNSKRLCVLFHHRQMRPSLTQPVSPNVSWPGHTDYWAVTDPASHWSGVITWPHTGLSLVRSPIVSILVIQLSNCRPRPLLRLDYKGLFSGKIVLGPEFLVSDSRKPLSLDIKENNILNLLYLHFAFSNLIFKHPVASMISKHAC